MHNEFCIVLEVVLGLFVAITGLFVMLIRLDQPFDRTRSTHDRHRSLHAAWVHLYLRPSHRKANTLRRISSIWVQRPLPAPNLYFHRHTPLTSRPEPSGRSCLDAQLAEAEWRNRLETGTDVCGRKRTHRR
jgi:hypothetical protein